MANVASTVAGVHNGGAVSVVYSFPVNGEVAIGQTMIKYTGMYPSEEALLSMVRAETNCKQAIIVSAVVVDQAYRENNYTCPVAQFMDGIEAPVEAKFTANHYEDARATVLAKGFSVKAKVLGMRQFEVSGAGKN
jgi:hypothetical protein